MNSPSSKIKGAKQEKEAFDASRGLPKSYGDTKITILPRDPFCFYAYWEVAAEVYGKIQAKLGENKFKSSKWTLRVYDITDVQFNGKNANKQFDVILGFGSENWYVNVEDVNRSWVADIGMVTPEGEFIVFARSNALVMPRQGVSTVTDEHWAILQIEFCESLRTIIKRERCSGKRSGGLSSRGQPCYG